MPNSILKDKSYAFAVALVIDIRIIQKEKKEYILSKQLLRSGIAVGALIAEAGFGQSKADFIHKLTISLKEANESRYWLCLLRDTGYLEKDKYNVHVHRCSEIIRILVASIKTTKQNLK